MYPNHVNPLVIYIYFPGKSAVLSTTLIARGVFAGQMKGTIRVMSLNFWQGFWELVSPMLESYI